MSKEHNLMSLKHDMATQKLLRSSYKNFIIQCIMCSLFFVFFVAFTASTLEWQQTLLEKCMLHYVVNISSYAIIMSLTLAVLFVSLATLQVCPRPTIVHVFACYQVRKLPIMITEGISQHTIQRDSKFEKRIFQK